MKRDTFAGAAAWGKREAKVGDRLPYHALLDEHCVLLRDQSVMISLLVPGLAFETADNNELNAHAAMREVVLRSALDARFVLYHHVIRRRVEVTVEGAFNDPIAAHIDARWRDRLANGELFLNDQFITLVRRPARGKAGWLERGARKLRNLRTEAVAADPADLRALRVAAEALWPRLANTAPACSAIMRGAGVPVRKSSSFCRRCTTARCGPSGAPRPVPILVR